MSDYTPTTDQVRGSYADGQWFARQRMDGTLAEFDRWFRSEIKKAVRMGAEEALRIVKEEWYPDE